MFDFTCADSLPRPVETDGPLPLSKLSALATARRYLSQSVGVATAAFAFEMLEESPPADRSFAPVACSMQPRDAGLGVHAAHPPPLLLSVNVTVSMCAQAGDQLPAGVLFPEEAITPSREAAFLARAAAGATIMKGIDSMKR